MADSSSLYRSNQITSSGPDAYRSLGNVYEELNDSFLASDDGQKTDYVPESNTMRKRNQKELQKKIVNSRSELLDSLSGNQSKSLNSISSSQSPAISTIYHERIIDRNRDAYFHSISIRNGDLERGANERNSLLSTSSSTTNGSRNDGNRYSSRKSPHKRRKMKHPSVDELNDVYTNGTDIPLINSPAATIYDERSLMTLPYNHYRYQQPAQYSQTMLNRCTGSTRKTRNRFKCSASSKFVDNKYGGGTIDDHSSKQRIKQYQPIQTLRPLKNYDSQSQHHLYEITEPKIATILPPSDLCIEPTYFLPTNYGTYDRNHCAYSNRRSLDRRRGEKIEQAFHEAIVFNGYYNGGPNSGPISNGSHSHQIARQNHKSAEMSTFGAVSKQYSNSNGYECQPEPLLCSRDSSFGSDSGYSQYTQNSRGESSTSANCNSKVLNPNQNHDRFNGHAHAALFNGQTKFFEQDS